MFACHRANTPALGDADHPDHPALVVLRDHLRPLRGRFRELLEQGQRGKDPKTQRFCAGLLEEYDALWTFCDVPGVDPTDNDAEVRHEVARFKWTEREEGRLMLAA